MIRKQTNDDGLVTVTFILPSNVVGAPISVVGNFNEWQPYRHPLIRRPDGTLSTTVVCHPGTTLYFRYLGSDGSWFDDMDADEINDQGGVLLV